MDNQIAIVGMEGILPGASGLDVFWQHILARRAATQEVPASRWVRSPEEVRASSLVPDHALSSRACIVSQEPPMPDGVGISAEAWRRLDPLFRWTLSAGLGAFSQAQTESISKSRIGCVLAAIALPTEGSCQWAEETLGRAFVQQSLTHLLDELGPAAPADWRAALGKLSHQPLPGELARLNAQVTGTPASMLSRVLGLGGGSYTLDAACASSIYALKLACDELLSGRADAMLAGGVCRPDQMYTQVGFSQLRALSVTGRCAPFDASADGLVVGEGAGLFLLKRVPDALRDGDTIHGLICGLGLSNDIRGSLLAPAVEGQLRAMKAAYKAAGWSPNEVDLIECHGTGTPLGDRRETESLCALWEGLDAEVGQCAIGSVKSNVGHLLTAAAAAGTIKALMALKNAQLPPSVNFSSAPEDSPLPGSPFRVQREASPWERREPNTPRKAAVSAFGFGGINGHMLLQEWDPAHWEHTHTTRVSVPSSQEQESTGDVAIVGVALHIGELDSVDAFREAIWAGQHVRKERPSDRWQGLDEWVAPWAGEAGSKGAFLKELSLPLGAFRLPPNEVKQTLPQQLLMLQVAAAAMHDAGLPLDASLPRMGAQIGIRFDLEATQFHLRWSLPQQLRRWCDEWGVSIEEEQLEAWAGSLKDALGGPLNAPRTVGALGGIVASRVAKSFGLGGPCFVVSAQENAGLCALEVALRSLRDHEVDTALVGAVDVAGDMRHLLASWVGQEDAGSALSALLQEGGGAHTGEGAVALVLKRYEDVAPQDEIYAVIKGIGHASMQDAPPLSTQIPPSVEVTKKAIERAFEDGGSKGPTREQVSLLESGMSGAFVRDSAEWEGLTASFAGQPGHIALSSAAAQVGQTHAVSGLLSVLKASLSLRHKLLPPFVPFTSLDESLSRPALGQYSAHPHVFHMPKEGQYWLRDRSQGLRTASVHSPGSDGNCWHVVLQEGEMSLSEQLDEMPQDVALRERYGLFVLEGEDVEALLVGLKELYHFLGQSDASLPVLAARWWHTHPLEAEKPLALGLVCTSLGDALHQVEQALANLSTAPERALDGRHGLFYTPTPLGRESKLAFVYPGSGNHYLGMGRSIGLRWPQIFDQMDQETARLLTQWRPAWTMPWRDDWSNGWVEEAKQTFVEDAHSTIFAQVVHGGMMTRLVQSFGVQPQALIGYSLGESAALFGMGVWPERGVMLARMEDSALFQTQLAGPCDAARQVWNVPEDEPVDWFSAIFPCPSDVVRVHCQGETTARLLIVNTPDECVVGGRKNDVLAVKHAVGCEIVPLDGIVTVHCDALAPVADEYKALHDFPVTPLQGVDVYSAYWEKAYELTSENASSSVLLQALHGFDYTQTIEQAYKDGVRLFVELGPRHSCCRMIRKILGDRPHMARSACVQGEDDVLSIYRLMASLVSERVPVSLAPLFDTIPAEALEPEDKAPKRMIHVPVGQSHGPIPLPEALLASLRGLLQRPKEPAKSPASETISEPVPMLDAPFPASSTTGEASVSRTQATAFSPSPEEPGMLFPLAVQERSMMTSKKEQEQVFFQPMPSLPPMGGAVSLSPEVMRVREWTQSLLQSTGATAQAHESYLRQSGQALFELAGAFQQYQSMWLTYHSMQGHTGLPMMQAPQQGHMVQQVPQPDQLLPITPTPAPTKGTADVAALPLASIRPAAPATPEVAFDYEQCMEFAIGSLEKVLGPMFAEVDTYPVRVRLPDQPLMLCDRILSVEGEKGSMTSGRLVTEHVVHKDRWYLDGECTPVCIAVEAGQADLFLCSYLGVDLVVKGKRSYRLLDAEIHFHRELPRPGETIIYDISIDKFVRQGDVVLFFFRFDGTIDGAPLLTMRKGCAGFFTPEEVEHSGGIIRTPEELVPEEGVVSPDYLPLLPMQEESYNDEQIEALRRGDLGAGLGPWFGRLPLQQPLPLPGGKMRLLDRILSISPRGGRFGLGQVIGEADIHPDDWFLTCHFVDDMVMPGTLMHECCSHTLRVLLMRMGWIGEAGEVSFEPVPFIKSALRCRGPVTQATKKVRYEVEIKEIGTSPHPFVVADALIYADERGVVSFKDMSMQLRGVTFAQLQKMWRDTGLADSLELTPPTGERKPAIYDEASILAYAEGAPSEAFGVPYRRFDKEHVIARLPRDPYLFLDRITALSPLPWDLRPGEWIEGEYMVPPDAWYFRANRAPVMPFGVLLEIVLQPCGWLAAYAGSALHGQEDLSFRNLGGEATLYEVVTPDAGLLTTRVRLTHVAKAGGMIIEKFDLQLWRQGRLIYEGNTEFGFFTKAALSQQVGIVGAGEREYVPSEEVLSAATPLELPTVAPLTPDDASVTEGPAAALPARALRMLDVIEVFEPEGGTEGLGFLRGVKITDPEEWFFQAHFYQDPVCPGSLGLESFLQLLKYFALERWGESVAETHTFVPILLHQPHRWVYRGQILARPSRVEVNASITAIEDGDTPLVKANGFLKVDGLFIYEMIDFGLRLVPRESIVGELSGGVVEPSGQ